MKKFILTTVLFGLLLSSIILVGILLPATPRASQSLLYAKIQKDSLLQHTPSPRIVFVGGSNLSLGLNSQTIKDSLSLHPINTAINASIGLDYMIDSTLPYIKKGDIVVLAAEYAHFYGRHMYGGEELLRTVVDTDPSQIFQLGTEQKKNIIGHLLKYSFSKFKPTEYFGFKEDAVYGIHSFNNYGDVYTHWPMKQQPFPLLQKITTPFNVNTIKKIKEFDRAIKEKEALLYVTYPGLQAASFDHVITQIRRVEKELKKTNLTLLGTAERYKMSNSLMFDTPYHLNKEGVDHRTKLFLEDFIKMQANNSRNQKKWPL